MNTLRAFVAALLFAAAVTSAVASYQNTLATQGYLVNATPDNGTAATLSGWFKVGATSSSNTTLLYNGLNTTNGWGCYMTAGTRVVNILVGGVNTAGGTIALAADTWCHVLVNRNGTSFNLAINGVFSTSLNATAIPATVGFTVMGAANDTSPHAIAVAEVSYLPRLCTADENTALAKGLSPLLLRPKYYWPLVRDLNEWMTGAALTITGTGVAADTHPRIYR